MEPSSSSIENFLLFSYISGHGNSKKAYCILENLTFKLKHKEIKIKIKILYFRRLNFLGKKT